MFCGWIYLKSTPAEDLGLSSAELAICNLDDGGGCGNGGNDGGSIRISNSSSDSGSGSSSKNSGAGGVGINIGALKSSSSTSSSSSSTATSRSEPTLSQLLTNPAFLGISAAHFAHNWGWYMELSWLPTYFSSLGVEAEDLGMFAVVPFLAMWAIVRLHVTSLFLNLFVLFVCFVCLLIQIYIYIYIIAKREDKR